LNFYLFKKIILNFYLFKKIILNFYSFIYINKPLVEMQFGEMQHFNNTPLGEMQSGEMQLSPENYLIFLFYILSKRIIILKHM